VGHYIWIKNAASCLCDEGELHVVCAGDAPLVAIAPLVRRRGFTGRMEVLGASHYYEPLDLVYSDPSSLTLLGEALAQLKVPIVLDRLPAGSPVIPYLRQALNHRGLVISRPAPGHAWIPLDETWIEPERHLNSGRRSDFRRARRIAEKMGRVAFEVIAPKPSELDPLIEEAFAVGNHGWKARSGTALACDSRITAFFRRYALDAAEAGVLRLAFFRIDGRAVAMQMAVESDGRFWLLKMEYDERSARCSPGSQLIAETIRYAARAGIHSYEFLGRVEPCTQLWTNHVHETVSLRIYPCALRGLTALIADSSSWARTAMVRRLAQASRIFHGVKPKITEQL
jgi:hypothetical protein